MKALKRYSSQPMNRSGFGLIEVMIAILIVAIMSLGAAVFISQSYKQVVFARRRAVAITLLESQLELVMNTPVEQLMTGLCVYEGDNSSSVWEWNDDASTISYFSAMMLNSGSDLSDVISEWVYDCPVKYKTSAATALGLPDRPLQAVPLDGVQYVTYTKLKKVTSPTQLNGASFSYYEVTVFTIWEDHYVDLTTRTGL